MDFASFKTATRTITRLRCGRYAGRSRAICNFQMRVTVSRREVTLSVVSMYLRPDQAAGERE